MASAASLMWRTGRMPVLARLRPRHPPPATATTATTTTTAARHLLHTTAPQRQAAPPPPPPPPPIKKKRAVLLSPLKGRGSAPPPSPSSPLYRRTPPPAPPPPPPPHPHAADGRESLSGLVAQRRIPLFGAGLAACLLGFLTLPLAIGWIKGTPGADLPDAGPDAVPTGIAPIGAAAFDASLDVPERVMGVARLRRRLAAAAHGRVLEVAVGTGRNLSYYPWSRTIEAGAPSTVSPLATSTSVAPDAPAAVSAFTGIDLSDDALGLARRRLRTAVPGALAAIPKRPQPPLPTTTDAATIVDAFGGALRLLRADAMQPLPLPAATASSSSSSSSSPPPRYDTIVQTFGLCSVADPVALLAHMAAAVEPGSGRILLLEHGRGHWPAVNAVLDRYAGRHCARYGCWWNRDMDAIVAQAQQRVPGLEVVCIERPGWFQLGTLWWIELRVAPSQSATQQ